VLDNIKRHALLKFSHIRHKWW